MSWDLLQRFFDSDVFNQNPFLSVSYLTRYADHVGIHYVLCNKLRQFPYEDIEFFLPQLCHLILSVDNESMALEEFLLDLCEESVTGALLTFWLFQTYLHDLSSNPQSYSFRTCRRVYNKVQHIVFGLGEAARHEKIQENPLPVTLLASFVLASVAVPGLPHWAGPLAVAQARKPQPIDDVISEGTQPKSLTRAHTVSATQANRPRRTTRDGGRITSAPDPRGSPPVTRAQNLPPSRPTSSSGSPLPTPAEPPKRPTNHLDLKAIEARLSTSSLPLPEVKSPLPPRPPTPVSAGVGPSDSTLTRRHSERAKAVVGQNNMTAVQRGRLLRQNYFRCQTQFLTALEDISNRLVVVPKPARLSALRAELALIASDLPAEVDVPVICPPTLTDGSPGKSKHHRIVRLNPAEATVLNSAEKVPYLLMVEILRDDFTFDPDSQDNQRLLATLVAEPGSRRRIFDLSDSPRIPTVPKTPVTESVADSVFEPSSGDLGTSPALEPIDSKSSSKTAKAENMVPQRQPSIPTIVPTSSELTTPGTSATSRSRSTSPSSRSLRRMTIVTNPRNASVDQPDFSALATHMRTASQMLAQLDATSGKRPKHEVAAIRAKIIASMQSLEEQNFEMDDGHGPTFDQIMAKTTVQNVASNPEEIDEETTLDTALNASAGVERMENDFKTGGLQRKGDRDDPSAAVFGEAWQVKKERIRRSSPYGWMKNWDLVSVIVKTGADLRQEAFACQLIDVCHRIWTDAGVGVWVKVMRILVTGESSGLIETITNGVSLHSIKRSLTLASIETGQNPRRRIATLRDHFLKAFGAPDSDAYKAGVDAFKRSLAAYSVISYVLQLKDRHNGNVLIDNEGHIVHIDFGFMLSNSPGSVGFEAAPFKLTHEYVEVLGGIGSPEWDDFKKLCKQAFQALRRSADNIVDLVAMMGRDSKMPCFAAGVTTVTTNLRQRFQLQMSADDAEQFVETDMIGKSIGSYYTRLYDTFQYRTQGIY
ncbi:Phosphatidylinositol 4-kinase PIK1 [Cytospora mali]|uniref:1-phosphatidylinositol 4-kinase n=1 Tax=Cytospora mali TaxID=578113 RepID=A0A194VMQ1_CYTMA|nr:Phosphatidylinositol 4-kinase PIK1 [Valsa mali]